MEKKLSIAEQLDLAKKALKQLNIRKERGEFLFMCCIFYDLLGLKAISNYSVNNVREYIELFTFNNMVEYSNAKVCDKAPYLPNEYEKRKKFLKWMISEYKSMLAKN